MSDYRFSILLFSILFFGLRRDNDSTTDRIVVGIFAIVGSLLVTALP